MSAKCNQYQHECYQAPKYQKQWECIYESDGGLGNVSGQPFEHLTSKSNGGLWSLDPIEHGHFVRCALCLGSSGHKRGKEEHMAGPKLERAFLWEDIELFDKAQYYAWIMLECLSERTLFQGPYHGLGWIRFLRSPFEVALWAVMICIVFISWQGNPGNSRGGGNPSPTSQPC